MQWRLFFCVYRQLPVAIGERCKECRMKNGFDLATGYFLHGHFYR